MDSAQSRHSRCVAGNRDGSEAVPYAFARFKNSDGRFAYLIYSAVDADGNIFQIRQPVPDAWAIASSTTSARRNRPAIQMS